MTTDGKKSGSGRLAAADWLKIAGLIVTLTVPPVTWLVAKATEVDRVKQHNVYQDREIEALHGGQEKLRLAQEKLPDLIGELKLAIVRLEPRAHGPRNPPAPGAKPTPERPEPPPCAEKDTACQIERMIERLRRLRGAVPLKPEQGKEKEKNSGTQRN